MHMAAHATDFSVDVPGGVLRGWWTGSGPPALILHGGPGLSEYTGALADELASAFTVLRYQQRGLEPSTTSGPFTVATHLADALAVLDALGAAPAYVVGHSWGGHLAMHLAAAHPDHLRGLVVVDPLGVEGDGGEADMMRIMAERIPPDVAARAGELDERAMQGQGTPEDAMESLALVWPAYFARPEHAPPMPPMTMSLPCYAETWASIHDELPRTDWAARLGSFRAPTAFVLGAQSPIPPHHGVASAALFPAAVTDVVEGCGHFLWFEQPGVVRRALDGVRAAAEAASSP